MTHSGFKPFLEQLRSFADETVSILMVLGALAAIAALMYLFSSPVARSSREFTGRIVDKKVSVYESEKGSSFVSDLEIEEKSGRRFRLSVTDEMFGRASVGMWIKRSKDGLDLLTDAEWRRLSP